MTQACQKIRSTYDQKIKNIVQIQRQERREAIFFVYKDGSTSKVFKGDETSISLTGDQQKKVLNQGTLKYSVHTHPHGLDLSTVDIMTGVLTQQDALCVAIPRRENEALMVQNEYVLTCLELSKLTMPERQMLFRAMRRSSAGLTVLGRLTRKNFNLSRFRVEGCRTVMVESKQSPKA